MILSIVIPVFNSERYLGRCLKSVFRAIALSHDDVEVILVDNGSSDSSLKIAHEYLEKTPLRAQILRCKAPGAAAVRNYGIKHAKGAYVWFIDADDEIAPSSIKKLLKIAKESTPDLIMMGAKRIYPDGHTDDLTAVDPGSPDYKSRFVRYGAGPWQFLISRRWWEQNRFAFKEGIIHEDMEMISSLILYTDNFKALKEPVYLYYQNPDSVLHKDKWDPHYLDIFEALEGLRRRFSEKNALEEYKDELEWFFIWNLLVDSAKDFKKFKEGRKGLRRSRKMLKKYYPSWRKNQFLKAKPLKLRLRVRLNYYMV